MAVIRPHLGELERVGLIQPALLEAEVEYLFRHALVHEGAYQSLLHQDRRALHQVVGETLAQLYPDRLDELAPMLGRHFMIAEDNEQAAYYYTRAGDVAYQRYGNVEAASHYGQALQHVLKLQTDSQTLQHLYGRRGRALELSGWYDEALANYQEMVALAQEGGDRPMELAGLVAQATLHAAPTSLFDPTTAERLSQEALVMAGELSDHQTEARIYWNWMLLAMSEDMEAAARHGEMSLAIARQSDLREQLAYTLNDIFRVYLSLGQGEKGWQAIQEAQRLWRELDNKAMLADNLASGTFYYLGNGDYERLIMAAEEAIALSEAIGSLWGQSYGRYALSLAYWLTGDWGKAIMAMEACVRFGEAAGFILASVEIGSHLAAAYATLGDYAQAGRWAIYVLAKAETLPDVYRFEALAARSLLDCRQGRLAEAEERLKGSEHIETKLFTVGIFLYLVVRCEVSLVLGRYEEMLAFINRISEQATNSPIDLALAQVYYFQGMALLGLNRPEEAADSLGQAREVAEKRGARPFLWRILLALSKIEAGRGNGQAAAELRQAARAVLQSIIDSLDDPDLRRSFQQTAEVQAAFN